MANSIFDEYDAAMQGQGQSGFTASAVPDAVVPSEPSVPMEFAKQFGSGGVEGTLGLLGFVGDAIYPKIAVNSFLDTDLGSPSSWLKNAITENIVAEPYDSGPLKWTRTGGEFLGPSLVTGGLGTLFKAVGKAPAAAKVLMSMARPAQLAADVAGAAGAEAGESIGGPWGRLFGGAAGQGVIPLGKNTAGALRDLFRGPTLAQTEGTAAKIIAENTGLTPASLKAAEAERLALAAKLPADQYRTTAELTKDPNMAQMEIVSTMEGQPHSAYTTKKALREDARKATIDNMSTTKAINQEGLGSELIDVANKNLKGQQKVASKYWEAYDKNLTIDVSNDAKELKGILPKSDKGSPLNEGTLKLVDDFSNGEYGLLTTEELQQIRSKALEKNRAETTLTSYDKKVRSWIADKARSYLEADPNWAKGAEKTSKIYDVFKTGKSPTSGGILVGKNTRASDVVRKVFRGDKQSATELKAAVGNDPQVMEDYKRGILDTLKRDAGGNLTLDKTQKFFKANENHLTEILGPSHTKDFKRVVDNLASEASVPKLAFTSTGKQSATGQIGSINSAMDVIVKQAGNPFLWRISPTAAYLSRILGGLSEKGGKAGIAKLKEVLAAAAMEPEYARMLLEKPTRQNIITIFDRMGQIAKAGVYGGAKGFIDPTVKDGPDVFDEFDSLMQGVSTPTAKEKSDMMLLGGLVDVDKKKEATPMTEAPKVKYTGPKAEIHSAIDEVAAAQEIDPKLLKALAMQESALNPKAVSDAGAIGLTQLMPGTARDIARKLGLSKYDLRDPKTNLIFGATYLKGLIEKYNGDLKLALSAYHSGDGRIDRILASSKSQDSDAIISKLGPIGRRYAKSVLKKMEA